MGKSYKPAVKRKKQSYSYSVRLAHVRFSQSLENASDYVTWLFDNDEGFKQFMKEEAIKNKTEDGL